MEKSEIMTIKVRKEAELWNEIENNYGKLNNLAWDLGQSLDNLDKNLKEKGFSDIKKELDFLYEIIFEMKRKIEEIYVMLVLVYNIWEEIELK